MSIRALRTTVTVSQIEEMRRTRDGESAPASIPHVPAGVGYLPGEKLALLCYRRGDLAKAILDKFRAMGLTPSKSDFRAMIEAGKLVRSGPAATLRLTPMGTIAAGNVLRDYARRLDIHVCEPTSLSGGRQKGVRCSCGWTAATPHGYRADPLRAQQSAIAQHMAAVADGSYSKARIDDAWARIDAQMAALYAEREAREQHGARQ